MLTINQILQQGRYRIVNQLGQNGIGVNYEAFDNVLGANVLLKEIRDNSGKIATPSQIEVRKAAFADRAKPLTEIKHESLLQVKDFFSEIDYHYLVAELAGGSSLSDLLEKKKSAFPVADVSRWADNLLDALNYLHTHATPTVHGEVKPQNIKLLPSGKVKLMIFNLVKKADEKIDAAVSNQTFDAAILPYMPLEQIWGGLDTASKKVILTNFDDKSERILEQPADPRTDLYSLAATLYHLLTARIPADALTRSIDMLEGKDDPLVAPHKLNPIVSPDVSDVLMNALEIKREDRFASAVIMRQVLRTASTRVKEREAAANKPVKADEDSFLEIPINKPKPTAPPVAAPKNTEMESEQARQLELIKKQLREAETRRLEAEQRAAQAEQRLMEAKKSVSVEAPVEQPAKAPVAAAPPVIEQIEEPTPVKSEAPAANYRDDDFSGMLAETQKESGVFKKAAAAAVVLLILGGAGFGIFKFVQPNSAQSVQSAVSNTSPMPEPTAQTTPAPTTETAPATTEQAATTTTTAPVSEEPSPTDAATTTTANPTAAKPKPVAATPTPQTAQVKKPAATPAKSADAQKKVTLDDLLKDN